MAEEATVNPDGSTTFGAGSEGADAGGGGGAGAGGANQEGAGAGGADDSKFGEGAEEVLMTKGTDPALFLLFFVILCAGVWFFFWWRNKKALAQEDDFFSSLDGEKFNLKLPAAVDEYYAIKEKCEDAGWEPGQKPAANAATNASGPHRVLAQALMKRCIADIPIVTHIQKESAGMNKLYSQSMCSVKQWRAYQAAEALVSSEVDQVRAEADEIEPGWSQSIWRQAMQYHNMLKQRHEMEARAASEEANKKRAEEQKANAAKKAVEDKKAKELAAEKAAQELIKAEERERQSKKAFKGGDGGMKKGFLSSK